jgi:hypothetical protein
MSSTFISALKAEIAQLEDQLRNDPRQRKLARLRETLAEYEPAKHALQASTGMANIAAQSKGDKIKSEIIGLLQQRGSIHRKEILNHLITIGLMGQEKDPIQSLASYFSGWRDTFEPDGAGNWSLIVQNRQAAE